MVSEHRSASCARSALSDLFSLSLSLALALALASSLLLSSLSRLLAHPGSPRRWCRSGECVRSPIDRKVCILARERQGERKRDTCVVFAFVCVASRRLASPRVASRRLASPLMRNVRQAWRCSLSSCLQTRFRAYDKHIRFVASSHRRNARDVSHECDLSADRREWRIVDCLYRCIHGDCCGVMVMRRVNATGWSTTPRTVQRSTDIAYLLSRPSEGKWQLFRGYDARLVARVIAQHHLLFTFRSPPRI